MSALVMEMGELTPFHSAIITFVWVLGKPLTLVFDTFEAIALFLSGLPPFTINT